MTIKKERQKRLKKILLDKKTEMWIELREEIFKKLGREYHEQFDNPQDMEEQSLVDLIEDTGLAIADIRRKGLEDMDAAIRKLEEGTYGICEDCGSEIGEDRLKAVPPASFCVKCQSAKESKKPTM